MTQTTYPASQKQIDFLHSLLKDAHGFYDPAFGARVIERINETTLTKDKASEAIEYLIRRADAKKKAGANAVASKVAAAAGSTEAPKVTEGFWITDSEDGKSIDVWKVQPNKAKTSVYALCLRVWDTGQKLANGAPKMKGKYDYIKGGIYAMEKRNPRPMTVAEAKAYGKSFGVCARCGASLSVDDSVERMMGPVCYNHLVASGHLLTGSEK